MSEIMDTIINNIIQAYGPSEGVFFLSFLPLIELKGAIPLAFLYDLDAVSAFLIPYLGSLVPAPFIILFIRPLLNQLKTVKKLQVFINRLEAKMMKKGRKVNRLGVFGLFLFVSIPLPGTGVWSGSFIASLLDMRLKIALPVIALGNLVAGLIVYFLTFNISSVL